MPPDSNDNRAPLRDLVEAMAAPGRPDKLGVVLGGTIAGFMGALLHARGIALWLVPLMMAWLLATAVAAIHLLRTVLRYSDERHHPNWWAERASHDIDWLIGEVERLRVVAGEATPREMLTRDPRAREFLGLPEE